MDCSRAGFFVSRRRMLVQLGAAPSALIGLSSSDGEPWRVVGLKPSKWAATSPTYGDWIPAGDIYGCSNWSPSPDTVTVNQHFTQTATDCKQDETRSVQHREQEYYSKAVRDVGSPGTEKQTVITSSREDLSRYKKARLDCSGAGFFVSPLTQAATNP